MWPEWAAPNETALPAVTSRSQFAGMLRSRLLGRFDDEGGLDHRDVAERMRVRKPRVSGGGDSPVPQEESDVG